MMLVTRGCHVDHIGSVVGSSYGGSRNLTGQTEFNYIELDVLKQPIISRCHHERPNDTSLCTDR